MNDGLHQQPLRVDENMTLLALDFLSRIEPVRIDRGPAFFRASHALAVDDGGGWAGLAFGLLTTRRRETNMREALNAIMYVLSTGCQWRYLPKDLPPRSTAYRYFCDWGIDGVLDRIHDALYEKCRR